MLAGHTGAGAVAVRPGLFRMCLTEFAFETVALDASFSAIISAAHPPSAQRALAAQGLARVASVYESWPQFAERG
jgi:hypothetical protein